MGPKAHTSPHQTYSHYFKEKKNLTLKKQIKAWRLQHHFEGKHVSACRAPL